MPSRFRTRCAVAAALGSSVLAVAANTHAQSTPTCASLNATDSGTVLYGAGGTAQQQLIGAVATQLAAVSPPVHVVYFSENACTGYENFLDATSTTASTKPFYWTADGVAHNCSIPAEQAFTFAVMGNSPALCSGLGDGGTSSVGTFLGPAQPLDFVVPGSAGGATASNAQSISTEAAYYVWGFFASDAAHSVSPWTVPDDIFTRNSTSFVSAFLALDLSQANGVAPVPATVVAGAALPDAGRGTQESTTQGTVTALSQLTGNDRLAGIGLVSGETADQFRGTVNILAYQHTGQSCGYFPDSTPTAFDKVNVRTGQYWLWSPVHFFAAVGDAGEIADPATASFVGLFTGASTAPAGVNVFSAEVQGAYTVPQCAMQAWRDGDLTPPYSYAPPDPCTCKFDVATNNTATRATSCQTCSQDSDCSTGHCRNIGPAVGVISADGGVSSSDAGAAQVGYCEVY